MADKSRQEFFKSRGLNSSFPMVSQRLPGWRVAHIHTRQRSRCGEPAHRVWKSHSQAWLCIRTSWAAFPILWCQVGDQNLAPRNILHSFPYLAKKWLLTHHLTFSPSFKHAHTHMHALVHTSTHNLTLSRFLLAAASSPSCIWTWAQGTEESGRSRGRLSLPPSYPLHSHPWFLIPKRDKAPMP
jgi:hypothetical protein